MALGASTAAAINAAAAATGRRSFTETDSFRTRTTTRATVPVLQSEE
jgi:hypothetical protein